MDAIDLLVDALALSIDADTLTMVVFSANLGPVRVAIPLQVLAAYFGAINDALEERSDEESN